MAQTGYDEYLEMTSLQSSLPYLFALALSICSVDAVIADGKFFRQLEAVDEPGIQAQRAVIAFKDGIETLIVQSDVQGNDTSYGSSYGWLLPLPAEPTAIVPCEPISLNALSRIVQPKFADSPGPFLLFSLALMLIMIAACFDHMWRHARGINRTSPARVALGVFVVLLLACLSLPSLSHNRGHTGGIEVLQTSKAGVYDVAVIKGQTVETVEGWLTSNGFACPPSARSVIQEYVANDWCFLAAKVAPSAKGTSTHHPLKISFPTSHAIYPMRLTGSDGNPIQLDLFVIAERQATTATMKTWVCDVFRRDIGDRRFSTYAPEIPNIYTGRELRFSRIGIPDVTELMWPGCVVTRLHARLNATDMAEDIILTWLDPKPTQARVYSQASAAGWSVSIAATAIVLLFAWFTQKAVKENWSWRVLVRRLAMAALVGILASGAWYATLEIVPAQASGRSAIKSMFAMSAHTSTLRELSKMPPVLPFAEAYRFLLDSSQVGKTLKEVTDFEKPGDYRIEPEEDGWRLTILDSRYIPITIPISSNGTPPVSVD